MDSHSLRAWWWHRQGLDGRLLGSTPPRILGAAGWARSVGGVNPYLTLFARAGTSREGADAAAARTDIHELPSARGCTYVVPQEDFGLALRLAQGNGDAPDVTYAKRHLGVSEEELQALAEGILQALDGTPKEPAAIKALVGDRARSLGEEGKKRGMTTTLPMVLGRLQVQGQILRRPVNGRLDQQRYGYIRWNSLALTISHEEACIQLAKRFWAWTGGATIANFQWFSGLGVKAARAVVAELGLVPLVDEILAFPEDAELARAYRAPAEPRYCLISSLDSLFLLRRDIKSFLDPADLDRHAAGEKGLLMPIGNLQDLANNAIVDRGRVVGLWEFNPVAGEIVWTSFIERNAEMRAAVAKTESFVRDQLGDARTFSLDSPESRKPALQALAAMG
jgi:hypothetical protein